MNIVFMGTPDFSVPTLEKLYNDDDINISYVLTKQDSKSNRGQKVNFSCVKQKALELNLNVLQPIKLKDDIEVIEKIKEAKPDFIVVVAYGQILPKEVLSIPKFACINGHASLLPKYRGASPIQSAILNGEKITGTTTMLMDIGLDTGDILEQKEVVIDKKETADSLFEKLSIETSDLICHTIKNFHNIKSIKQDETLATKSVLIKKENGLIDFKNENREDVDRKIRAYTSWPSAYFIYENSPCKLWDVDIIDDNINEENLIRITDDIFISNDKLVAKCKNGYLQINELQKSGKNKIKARDFMNGIQSINK